MGWFPWGAVLLSQLLLSEALGSSWELVPWLGCRLEVNSLVFRLLSLAI